MEKAEKNMAWNMTEGPSARLILRFSFPMMIGNVFQQFYNLADSIVVGRFIGSNELGGIGCTGSIHYLIFSLGFGMAAGIGVLVAMLFGAGETTRLTRAIYNSFYALLGVSFLITMGGCLFAEQILRWMNTPEAVFPHALLYLRIILLGSTASIFYSGIASIMRSFGDSRTPLMILIFSCVMNVALDVLFVVCFRWGVPGVAVATVLSECASAVLSYLSAWRKLPLFRYRPGALRMERRLLSDCLRFGLPIAGQNMMIAFSCIVLQSVVNGFGELVVTANTAVSKLEQLVGQPYDSLSVALCAYTGQNIGAKKTERVREGFRFGLVYIAVVSAIMLVVMRVFGNEILSVFVKDPEIIEIGARALRITSTFYLFLGLIYVVRGILNGAGDTTYSAMNGVIELVCRTFIALQLTRIASIGMWGCFLCTGLTWTITGLLSLVRYLSGRWLRGVMRND